MCLFIIMSISVRRHKLWCTVRDMRLSKCSIIIISITHLAHPLVNTVTASTTTAKRIGELTDPWCIPTLTSNCSDNSESTLTLVFAPSYRLISDLTQTYLIPFFINAHSTTFLGTLSKTFTRSTKHIHNFLHLACYSSCSLLKINTASIVTLSGIKPNCISSTVNILQSLFSDTLSTTFIPCSRNFTVL